MTFHSRQAFSTWATEHYFEEEDPDETDDEGAYRHGYCDFIDSIHAEEEYFDYWNRLSSEGKRIYNEGFADAEADWKYYQYWEGAGSNKTRKVY
jgi:hypothetical protein